MLQHQKGLSTVSRHQGEIQGRNQQTSSVRLFAKAQGGSILRQSWGTVSFSSQKTDKSPPHIKPNCKDWKKWLIFQMPNSPKKITKHIKKQKAMVQRQEHIKFPGNDMEIYEITDKECKLTVIRMLNKWKESTHRQLNKIRKTCMSKTRISRERGRERNYKEETNRNSEAEEYNNWI